MSLPWKIFRVANIVEIVIVMLFVSVFLAVSRFSIETTEGVLDRVARGSSDAFILPFIWLAIDHGKWLVIFLFSRSLLTVKKQNLQEHMQAITEIGEG